MNAETIAILEAYINETDPEPWEPVVLAPSASHCDCGTPNCHYHCDPAICIDAAFEAMRESILDNSFEADYCDACGGRCVL